MAFGQSDWDIPDAPSFEGKLRRFWMKPGDSKRVMLVCNEFRMEDNKKVRNQVLPFRVFEHSLYPINKSRDSILCAKRCEIRDTPCCFCDDKDLYAVLSGYFTIIEFGNVVRKDVDGGIEEVIEGWIDKQGTEHRFEKKLLGAKHGSKDKPGVLKRVFMAQSNKRGNLEGHVYDVTRSGSKSENIGDMWEFVEKVPRKDWQEYFQSLGATEEIDCSEFDYFEEFQASSDEEMRNILNSKGSGNSNSNYNNNNRNNNSGSSDLDKKDIPF